MEIPLQFQSYLRTSIISLNPENQVLTNPFVLEILCPNLVKVDKPTNVSVKIHGIKKQIKKPKLMVFSNVRSVLSQCNTRIIFLHLLYDIDFTRAFSMFYALIKHGFLTNQSAHRVLSML